MTSGDLRVAAIAAPLRTQVVRNLREAILDRRFTPGQRLVERELCELTGVSRTTVREALRQLETEGLVVLVPNQGPVVATMSLDEARDVYDVRGVLEALAASRFAASATDEQVRDLAARTDAFEEAMRSGDAAATMARKDQFYEVLLDGAGNTILRQQLASLWGRIAFLRSTSLRRAGRGNEVIAEVRAVLDAVVARDPDRAWAVSRLHVEHAAEAAFEVLEAEAAERV
ncbi:MAG: GntR family transcriptional regulator [Streptosporangiales bacterium]|nr:GntR family transcriptional regulator [Streptosporangiales bacterium]